MDIEKRIDPADLAPYTWQEFYNFYKGHYWKKDIAKYWEACGVFQKRKKMNKKSKTSFGAEAGSHPDTILKHALAALSKAIQSESSVHELRCAYCRLKVAAVRIEERLAELEQFAVKVTTLSGQTAEIAGWRPHALFIALCERVEKELGLPLDCTDLCLGTKPYGPESWSKQLQELDIGDGTELTCISYNTWMPIGDSPVAIRQEDRTLTLDAASTGVTSIVSARPMHYVEFRVTDDALHAQRNLGLAIGSNGHARSHFTLIAEVGNQVFAGSGLGRWDVHRYGSCSQGDVLSLRYDLQSVFFERNGESVCPPRQLELNAGEQLFAYASIHHSGGRMCNLRCSLLTAAPRDVELVMQNVGCSYGEAYVALLNTRNDLVEAIMHLTSNAASSMEN